MSEDRDSKWAAFQLKPEWTVPWQHVGQQLPRTSGARSYRTSLGWQGGSRAAWGTSEQPLPWISGISLQMGQAKARSEHRPVGQPGLGWCMTRLGRVVGTWNLALLQCCWGRGWHGCGQVWGSPGGLARVGKAGGTPKGMADRRDHSGNFGGFLQWGRPWL